MTPLLLKIIRNLVPPVVSKLVWLVRSDASRFKGDYRDWKDALSVTVGYQDSSILTAVQESARKVARGEAKYERDQILFNDNVKRWPLIGAMLMQSLKTSPDNTLSVMDFGGSLGSTYYQIRDVIEDVVKLRWSIVDQAHFVAAGKAEFETDVLRFRESISECLGQDQPTVALLSCVLNYVENPYDTLEEILSIGLPMVVLDRTLVIEGSKDRLAVQLVSDKLGGGSYPIWFLSREKLENFLPRGYTILSMFDGLDGTLSLVTPFDTAHSRGYVLVKK